MLVSVQVKAFGTEPLTELECGPSAGKYLASWEVGQERQSGGRRLPSQRTRRLWLQALSSLQRLGFKN